MSEFDSFVDERDYELLEADKYTFFFEENNGRRVKTSAV